MALVAVIVLAVDPWTVQAFVVPKWMVLAAGVPLALTVLVARGQVRLALGGPWAAVVAVVGSASVLGAAPVLSLVGAPFRYLGAITWLLWWGAFTVGASTRSARTAVVDALCALAALNAVIALAQRVGVDPFAIQSDLDRSRAWGTFGSGTLLGGFAAVVLPVAAARLASTTVTRPSWAWAGVVGAGASLALAGSRGPLLGALVGLVLVGLRLPRARRAMVGVGLAVLVGVLVTPSTGERVLGRSELAASTATGRLDQWRLTVDLIQEDLLLGSGPETYRLSFPSVIDDGFEREHGGDDVTHDRAHNVLLDTWVITGLLGVVALGWLALAVLRGAWRDPSPEGIGLAGALAAHVIALQFGFQDAHLDAVVWLLAGLAVSPTPVAVPTASTRLSRRPVIGLAAAATLVLGGWALRDVVADHRLHQGLEDLEQSGPLAALDSLESAASLAPERILYRQVAARAALAAGRPERAVALLDEALDVAPGDVSLLLDRARAESHAVAAGGAAPDAAVSRWADVVAAQRASGSGQLGLGIALAEAGRLDDAGQAWRRATELLPDDPAPRRNLARLAEIEGDDHEATRWWNEVLEVAPDDAEATAALAALR